MQILLQLKQKCHQCEQGRRQEEIYALSIQKESLNNEELNKLTNSCDTFQEKFVVWTFLDTG